MLYVGAAQNDITPELPVILGGSFARVECNEVMDPICASTVVVDNGNKKIAIISCDLGRLDEYNVNYIREKICEKIYIDPLDIQITATHNHQGPTVVSYTAFKGDIDQSLFHTIAEKIVLSVVKASENMQPCKMGYGRGSVEKCAFNRRYIMSNGRSKMHPGPNNPDRLMVEGPVDKEVQTVWFEDENGNPVAVMVNFSSHAAILYAYEKISADFPGMMRSVLQSVIGTHVPVLYLTGCCGNVHPSDQENDAQWGRGVEGVKRVGSILAGEVLKIIMSNYALEDHIEIKRITEIVDLPFKEITEEKIQEAERLREAFLNMGWAEARKHSIEERAFVNAALTIAQWKKKHPFCKTEISAFCLGDVCFVTNPAELFVEYQLEIKKKFKDKKLIVMELTNGYIAYVPTKVAFALGGYEAVNSRLGLEAGGMIVEASAKLLNKL